MCELDEVAADLERRGRGGPGIVGQRRDHDHKVERALPVGRLDLEIRKLPDETSTEETVTAEGCQPDPARRGLAGSMSEPGGERRSGEECAGIHAPVIPPRTAR